tara:strand:- start:56 stop:472 length:417 start_codon:yes stop_codon:yes gene_type:complete
MAKPEWGRKRICQSCGTKYYDLNKSSMICPSCGAQFDQDLFLKNKKSKTVSTKVTTGNDNELTEDIPNIDDIEVEADNEVVSDDDPLLEINKEEQNDIPENEIGINDDISFIDDEGIEENDISDDNGINVEIDEENKN